MNGWVGLTLTLKETTGEDHVLGTVAYMSPEQVEGKKLDARSDVFSFGTVLYQMSTGRQAFCGDSQISTMSAILRDAPQPVRAIHPKVPAAPEIARLAQRDYASAYSLAKQAGKYIPGNARLDELSRSVSVPVSIETNVPGAEIRYKHYSAVNGKWQQLGHAPLNAVTIPRGLNRWRISKEGFRTVEAASSPDLDGPALKSILDEEASIPADMVRVPAARGSAFLFLTGLDHLPAPALDDFLIDTYQVTNRQFATFVTAGGYRKPEFWKHRFKKGGRVLSWQEAMAEFRDSTGQPGPATWELGSYLAGQEDLPVAGVSWYEATAYAEFTGKSLPSICHWNRAAWTNAGFRDISPVVRLSNFVGQGPARVGENPGMNPYGTHDLAGNVKEWCWNAATDCSATVQI